MKNKNEVYTAIAVEKPEVYIAKVVERNVYKDESKDLSLKDYAKKAVLPIVGFGTGFTYGLARGSGAIAHLSPLDGVAAVGAAVPVVAGGIRSIYRTIKHGEDFDDNMLKMAPTLFTTTIGFALGSGLTYSGSIAVRLF